MIGNKIEFVHYDWGNYSEREENRTREDRLKTGLVVDAFTEVKGRIKGSTDVFLGFGGGSTRGETNSERKYKVEYYEPYSKNPRYIDIYAWQMQKIISFAGQTNQEVNEEKIITD